LLLGVKKETSTPNKLSQKLMLVGCTSNILPPAWQISFDAAGSHHWRMSTAESRSMTLHGLIRS